MKVDGYEVPEDLLYTEEHEWLKLVSKDRALVGITDYAAKLLHEIVYVSLPDVGSEVKFMEVMGSVESIKAVSDIYSPITGKVTKVNEELSMKPELVNQSPYKDGWMIEVEPKDLSELEKLLKPDEYAKLIKS